MRQLQKSFTGKAAAWTLLLLFSFAAAWSGLQVGLTLSYASPGQPWQDTHHFYRLLQWRQDELAYYMDLRNQLDNTELDYLERQTKGERAEEIAARMQTSATQFRFQVKSADGTQVLYTNASTLRPLAEQVEHIEYASFRLGEGVSQDMGWGRAPDELVPTQEQGAAPTYIIECGVAAGEQAAAQDEFSKLEGMVTAAQNTFTRWVTLFALSGILTAAVLIYILWTAGHSHKKEGIVQTWQDRMFLEGYLAIAALGAMILCWGMTECMNNLSTALWSFDTKLLNWWILGICAGLMKLMALTALCLRTAAVRLKGRCLLNSILCYRFLRWCWEVWCRCCAVLPLTWRWAAGYTLFAVVSLVLGYVAWPLMILIHLVVLLALCWWMACLSRIREGGRAIAQGNLNLKIDTKRFPPSLRSHAQELNSISHGMAAAVNEQMKSERFKAELITNVSHDLKTPLTSIINYVDLLKQTRQTDPAAGEYIEVLDRKSQRLKKLTEDLVEASKASTGALSVAQERIDLRQLIEQTLGEWEEKLAGRGLSVVPQLAEGETWVWADGRHLWRVMDNLLSNCAKYALEGTRIYLELTRAGNQASVSVKNISAQALTLQPEQLVERFVRGEESRSTEGSGLGLSIARSLTQLQGGTFEVVVDGDLFKVVLTLAQVN